MIFRTGLIASFILLGVPAQAATIGLYCGADAAIVIAPSEGEALQCAASMTACVQGFSVGQGYFAIAQSADGLGKGAAGGFKAAESAAERALTSCETLGAGPCGVVIDGLDDGASYVNCGAAG